MNKEKLGRKIEPNLKLKSLFYLASKNFVCLFSIHETVKNLIHLKNMFIESIELSVVTIAANKKPF